MPSVSIAQHRLMQAVAHDPKFARKVHIAQKVGKDFSNADRADKRYGRQPEGKPRG
jgi:hypothetical protein